jgi:cytoskeletal protein RodZ
VSIGETLAEARHEAGLTIAQVSQRTRIRESIVRSVEQGDFSPCGGDFYARGHIRSIAGVVGIDPAPLLREYDGDHHPAGITAAEAFSPTTPIKIREPRQRRFPAGILAAVVLLAVIGFGIYQLVGRGGGHSAASPAVKASPVATATPTTPKASPSPSAKPTPTQAETVVSLTAAQDCWLNVSLPNGKQVYQGTLRAGRNVTWTEKHKVNIAVGNPSGVTIRVNGKVMKANTVQVVTLRINPLAASQATLAAPSGATLTTSAG